MSNLTFSRLLLLSDQERSGLQVRFSPKTTVIQAMNGFGKSAVLKTLYETFGASPHKVDDRWRSARTSSAVEFTLDGAAYCVVKAYGMYALFDEDQNLQFRTSSVTSELGPHLGDLLNFKLLMTNKEESTIRPPPSYIFAPYYVDQDQSWVKPWASFKDLYLPRSAPTLAEYHSGIKTNAYYEAQAERDRLNLEARELDNSIRGLNKAIGEFRQVAGDAGIQFDVASFQVERELLVSEAGQLMIAQAKNRADVASLAEERRVWEEQTEVISASLAEIDSDFAASLFQPAEVECPTCGQHYTNGFLERFHIVDDKDSLIHALVSARERTNSIDNSLQAARRALSEVEASLAKVRVILSVAKDGLTFAEILASEGRTEATRILREKLSELDAQRGDLSRAIDTQIAKMQREANPNRARGIRTEFNTLMSQYAAKLDVSLGDRRRQPIHSAGKLRGSEGTREILAYYFAFFHTAQQFGSSTKCPIVIDAPNQQGQDELHLPTILQFIVETRPSVQQLIVAVEDAGPLEDMDVDIVRVGKQRRQVLDEDQFAEVTRQMRPYLSQLLLS